jgi:hypothetical protein
MISNIIHDEEFLETESLIAASCRVKREKKSKHNFSQGISREEATLEI